MQRLLGAILLVVLLAAGCTSDPVETTADSPPAATAAPGSASTPEPPSDATAGQPPSTSDSDEPPESGLNDPTAGPDRAPDEPRLVPPLELPATAPGSDAAAAALIEELNRFVTPEQRGSVPWPDMRNPDPIAVYQSDAAFQNWMSANNPTPSLVEAYTAPRSPERGFDLEMFDFRSNFDLRSGPATPPYSMRIEALVHPAATGITDALLAQVPEGSAAIIYWDSVGRSDTFTVDGQYWASSEGWVNVGPWVAIMAPTDVGWQVWWDELTEPPPPGSREQRGTPQGELPRRDV